MTLFIIILVAAPVVFWLFRKRQSRGVAGIHQDEDKQLTATVSERGRSDEQVKVAEAAAAEPPVSQSPLAPLPSVLGDDVPAELASQDRCRIPQYGTGPADDSAGDPGQASVGQPDSVGQGATHFHSFPGNDESKKTAIRESDSGPAATLPPDSSVQDLGFDREMHGKIAVGEETGAAVQDHYVAGGTRSDEAESVALTAPPPQAETLCPAADTGPCEEPVNTDAAFDDGEPLKAVELPRVSGGEGEQESLSEVLSTAAGLEDLIDSAGTNSEVSEPVESAIGSKSASLDQPQPPRDNDAELDDISVAEPARYRPPPQRQARRSSARPESAARAPRSGSVLEIRVRLILDRFGFSQTSLLPERKPEMDDEITVKAGPMRLTLAAQEDWYGDLYFDDIGERLRRGIRIAGLLSDGRRVQWQLSGGREIYVLAGHTSASGFVSVPRLILGRPHVVLCTSGVVQEAEAILKEAGCNGYTKMDPSHGVPDGWTGFRGVSPETALTLDPDVDPFYALKPAPDIEISFDGGLLLHDSAWLSGYPPQIRVTGQTTGELRVLIDGKQAHAADGCYVAAGFDAPGQHLVEFEGLSCSRSYSIEEPEESWEQWKAYGFSGADVCGPLVALRPEAWRNRVFTVPMTNPLLLGAEPGQVFRCSHRNVANWHGFVPFEVVWALPAQPLICDKKTSRILRFSSASIVPANPNRMLSSGWCSAILDASRKGLRIEGASPDSTAQWIEYKKTARNIWRGRR